MNLFKKIGLRNCGETCEQCIHFENDPAEIEKAYPGLKIMSSGYAAVRDRDGLCSLNQLYLSAGDSCEKFQARPNSCLQKTKRD